MKNKLFFILTGLLLFSACANLSGLKTLMQLGKSDKLKEKALKQETENFNKVKKALSSGKIKKSLTKKEVKSLYGEPVITISEDNREKWVYKRADTSWFSGEKIYLFFNSQGKLETWELKQ